MIAFRQACVTDSKQLVVLIRHAESEKNIHDYHGHDPKRDFGLTESGRAEAERFAASLTTNLAFASVVSSTSRAPTETAECIAVKCGQPILFIDDIRAVGMGFVAGLRDSEIQTQYPEIYAELKAFKSGRLHPKDLNIPNREKFEDFSRRIQSSLTRISELPGPVAIIAHHSVINMVLHVLRVGDDINSEYQKHSFPNLSITTIRRQSPAVLSTWLVEGIALRLE